MPVGKNKTVIWYSIYNGKIRHKNDDGDEYFDYIEGNLVSIERVKDTYKGQPQTKYYFKIEPDDHSYVEILKVGENSSALRGLLAALTTIPEDNIRQVRIRPYTTTETFDGEPVEFTNLDVSYRNHSGQEYKRLVEIESTHPTWRKIFHDMPDDENERSEFLRRMAEHNIGRLNHPPQNEGLQPGESLNHNTGEVTDHKRATEDTYGGTDVPGPARPEKDEIHKQGGRNDDYFKDMDDDLPF